MDTEILEVHVPKTINVEIHMPEPIDSIEFNQGIKGERGVSITDFTLDDDGNAVTTFDNGETKTSKLTSIASVSASAKKAATSEANAKDSADKALISETNAKTSETNAATYADNAKDSEEAAKFSEINAKNSEKSAKSSEEISLAKAEEASASATSASNSAVKAMGSALNSAKSAESAEDSYNKTVSIQNNFQVVLDTAKASETNAKASEANAAASASTATTQANTATTQANNAKTSATNSSNSASASATSASNAKTSETNANSSATTAKNWAVSETSPDGATDADSGTGKTQSSRTWALESRASAQSASSNASIATTQASSATASANSASASATSASGSATSAASSATAASNSASAAATSATNASNSESQASEYKTSASGSATAAASSASSASTSATNAKAAMNTANTAASSASASATSASTSASNASKSEIAAKTAQAAAEKARDDANSAVNKLTGVMKYAGQVDNYSDLADVTKNKGDVWNIANADNTHGVKAGDNVVWNGTDWDNLSGYVDLSAFAQKDDYQKVITSATANGATITFNHKDGTTSTTTVNNVASATAATNDAKGQKIDTTYEKIADASNVHASLQNSINSLSTGKQDKLTFDTAPTAGSTNPVTSNGIKSVLDKKLDKSSLDDNFCIEWDEGNNVVVYNKSTPSKKVSINPYMIAVSNHDCGLFIGTNEDFSGIALADISTGKIHILSPGDKLQYYVFGGVVEDIATENYVQNSLDSYATKSSLASYQPKLTFDSTPTANSSNPVTSDGIKKAIDAKTVDLSNYYTKTQIADTYVTKTLWQSSQSDMGEMLYQFTNQLQRNKTYSVGDIAYSPWLPSWAYLECITAGTTGDEEPDFSSVPSTGGAIADMADGNVHWRVRDTRCRYEVGDIIAKTATPKSYEYLLPCNGASFDKTKYPLLAKVFANGKVPNLTDGRFLEGSTASGTSKNAGLPNITGKIGGGGGAGAGSGTGLFRSTLLDGALAATASNNYGDSFPVFSKTQPWPDGDPIIRAKFDASLSNNIYGASNTVQPKSYTVVYYVCYGG